MKNRRGLWIGIIGTIIIVLIIGYRTTWYQSLLSGIAYPVVRANAAFIEPTFRWLAADTDHNKLKEQVHIMQQQYRDLERLYVQLKAKMAYLNGIKEVLIFSKRFQKEGLIARVLARACGPDEHSMLVDAGSTDGVTPDTVVLHNGTVVGKIHEIYPWYSKVRLITDKRCKVGAYCAMTRVHGIHEGCNQQQTVLRYVDHLSPVETNDCVLTSGEGLLFPEGFALGWVSCVEPDGLYKQITVTPACDFEQIEYCLLLTKAQATHRGANQALQERQ